jgi:hypothetical protein
MLHWMLDENFDLFDVTQQRKPPAQKGAKIAQISGVVY